MDNTAQPLRVEYQGEVDLSQGRTWMFFIEIPRDIGDAPKLFIDQFASNEAVEEEQPEAHVWLHPEDLARLIEELNNWLGRLRVCAEDDAKRNPPFYWGDLGAPAESTRRLFWKPPDTPAEP